MRVFHGFRHDVNVIEKESIEESLAAFQVYRSIARTYSKIIFAEKTNNFRNTF